MRTVLILLLLYSPALAHDASHPELNDWFNRLQSGRGLCCSFADGSAVRDVDWESKDGHYRIRLEGRWITVPDEALITEPDRWDARWFGRFGLTAKPLSGASCPAAWARSQVRASSNRCGEKSDGEGEQHETAECVDRCVYRMGHWKITRNPVV